MARFLKHVGINHLGSKLVIVFRELPDDPDHCLCVESQSLPDMYHDNLMRVLESGPAQETVDLYNVLKRSRFGDGTEMLQSLHQRGLLKKYSVDQVSVVPMPNRQAPLREVNNQIRSGNESALTAPAQQPETPAQDNPVVVDTQPLQQAQQTQQTQPVDDEAKRKSEAESKLLQARLMEDDAQKLRAEAYKLDPDLKKGGRPSKEAQAKAKAAAEASSVE